MALKYNMAQPPASVKKQVKGEKNQDFQVLCFTSLKTYEGVARDVAVEIGQVIALLGDLEHDHLLVDWTKRSFDTPQLQQKPSEQSCGFHVLCRVFQIVTGQEGFTSLQNQQVQVMRTYVQHLLLTNNKDVCRAVDDWEKQMNDLRFGNKV